ncbi:hypothetical protein FA10DRAFT_267256 [Acaromyces ingoldii]|uniref:Uncharacterized protein n=1 Tax=Acaromyces ingoldii TaxID=215250 RepID=A0A316YSW7_9BASI|nr:hypothetical protein FA10DRAFT_267256 [Acaromyces ingoldii]PWN90825.1 hypothetical protein FA10DRAFT_267256 [Acaromyces ingoldii]
MLDPLVAEAFNPGARRVLFGAMSLEIVAAHHVVAVAQDRARLTAGSLPELPPRAGLASRADRPAAPGLASQPVAFKEMRMW